MHWPSSDSGGLSATGFRVEWRKAASPANLQAEALNTEARS